MHGIPRALGCIAYLSVWRQVGALCVERLAVFVPSLPTLCFPLCISVRGAHSSRGHGGSWLGCQVLPAIGAVSILELAANSGSSRMFRAPNLQRATMLFTLEKHKGMYQRRLTRSLASTLRPGNLQYSSKILKCLCLFPLPQC